MVVACAWAIRHRNRSFGLKEARRLSVADSLSLGQNRMLCLVKWEDDMFLLGVTDHCVSLIKASQTSGAGQDLAEIGAEADLTPAPDEHEARSFVGLLGDEIRKAAKRFGRNRMVALALLICVFAFTLPALASAAPEIPVPEINVTVNGEAQGGLGNALGILGMLTVLSLAPAILILTTSFTRMVVVFSFLRSGLGTQQTPPNQVMIGLALLLTFFVMAPTWGAVNEVAIQPYVAGAIDLKTAIAEASGPLKIFMLKETRESDLALFASMSADSPPDSAEDLTLLEVVPAFAISELKTAFEMGFMLFLPFLVVDMVVASTLMSMGMLMLPPVLISLPFKILLFVLVDGWALITKSLVNSFV